MGWLTQATRDEVVSVYQRSRSIRHASRMTGVARNTVRSILEAEGLRVREEVPLGNVTSAASPIPVDLGFLEDIFLASRHPADKTELQKNIEAIINACIASLGGRLDPMDMMRIEAAMAQFILYRRHFIRSLEASDRNYSGPYAKSHEKAAKAAHHWMEAANKALFAWNRLFRELEMKHGRLLPENLRELSVKNTQVNISPS